MFYTQNSLNSWKILFRVVEFYLHKWQWPYIKLRTYIQIMIHLLRREWLFLQIILLNFPKMLIFFNWVYEYIHNAHYITFIKYWKKKSKSNFNHVLTYLPKSQDAYMRLTSSSWSFFARSEEGLPWWWEWNDLPRLSYSTLREKRTFALLLILNPLMPVARPSLKETPPSPPQGPSTLRFKGSWTSGLWTCVCHLVKKVEATRLVIMLWTWPEILELWLRLTMIAICTRTICI